MLWNSISITILVYIFYPLIIFILTRDPVYFIMFIGILSCAAIVKLLKVIFPTVKRPKGACDCGAFNQGGNDEGQPGMPSGHVACITYFFVFLGVLRAMYGTASIYDHTLYIVIAMFLITMMSLSRYHKKCHDVRQIIGGIVVGTMLAIVNIMLWLKMKNYIRALRNIRVR
jgi:hypothetical protein